jgi:hypothetical protein
MVVASKQAILEGVHLHTLRNIVTTAAAAAAAAAAAGSNGGAVSAQPW